MNTNKPNGGNIMAVSVLWLRYSDIILALQKQAFELFQYSSS